MQALDSFISPIPGFEGDIPILAIPISTYPPSGEYLENPSAGPSVDTSKTQTGKWKATTNPTLQKKVKKAKEKPSRGIKTNEPTPKAPTSTPPSVPRKESRSTDQEGIPISSIFFITEHLVIMNLHAGCPKISTQLPLPIVL
jgi:hypothetical protein